MPPKGATDQATVERGIIGDTVKKLRGQHGQQPHEPTVTQQYQPQLQGPSNVQPDATASAGSSSFFGKMKSKLSSFDSKTPAATAEAPSEDLSHHSKHRFGSFAPRRKDNNIKWFVDGCSYMWAVSVALENAQKSIWILDWWLSPELYLRRPPAKFEKSRVDRMLHAAAERGVKVNIIVYKEVTQALTLSSNHTKHWLEGLHPNIAVMRHPDHLPDAQAFTSSFMTSMSKLKINAATLAKLPGDALSAVYGMNEETVLYWAHHEKLCLIDGSTAFMGGLDLCFGRWDTNQHPISDTHPGNLDRIIFPGQDYNNARIMDFQNVDHPDGNKLDRTTSSRMGWSDLSLCLTGPATDDLKTHFVQRWNYIYDDKYRSREDKRFSRLTADDAHITDAVRHKVVDKLENRLEELEGRHARSGGGGMRKKVIEKLEEKIEKEEREQDSDSGDEDDHFSKRLIDETGVVNCQIMRSCTKWSHGVDTEHSIQNAYCETIKNSKHFIYIENQFFITATSEASHPVKNMIGAALVERIIRAARLKEKFKVIVVMPAVPAFAGDLKPEAALGTRAIMEFQYFSICRGGHSIMECVAKEGIDPLQYIRFYNLRSYDRLNTSATMQKAEQKSGVPYEDARKEHDDRQGAGYGGQGESAPRKPHAADDYQHEAVKVKDNKGSASGRWDTVSECYMLGGEDIRNVPWDGDAQSEIEAFVSEELYVHTKLLIADDQTIICGSANLNDRSQLGSHDSEIAIFVEPPLTKQSTMNGKPWPVSEFAASLRRQLFRKHLGLLKPQQMDRPDKNFLPVPVPNEYDWDSPEDQIVTDPLSEEFLNLWNTRARQNTDAFGKIFHPVPSDAVKNWSEYDTYYEKYFAKHEEKPAMYKWGHVVAEEFPPGQKGIKAIKDLLSTIKGNLVEMPLMFLKDEDIAKEGLTLNAMTEVVYT